MNARKLALALQYVRDNHIVAGDVDKDPSLGLAAATHLIVSGTTCEDNAETNDPTVPYTDDDEVMVTYTDGSQYRLIIEKVK